MIPEATPVFWTLRLLGSYNHKVNWWSSGIRFLVQDSGQDTDTETIADKKKAQKTGTDDSNKDSQA